ncbi:MAG: IclR family transcriptional regulator [Rhodoferax sp.]|nr:IclR family transcriptional regulator [Rhodoferax sp.]
MTDTDTAAGDRYLVPALQRGMQLLGQFSRNERELTGAELSRRLGLPRASVFRLLQTLEQMGFVERVGDSASYKLGIAVLRLGFEYLASMELTEHGRPVLDDLCGRTGLTAHLVVRDGLEVVFVAKATGRSFMFNSIQVGARLPVHATVLGRVLLGGSSLADLTRMYGNGPLQAYTPQTPTTLAALKDMVDADAQRGYGVSQGGFESGISTIAAPVFDEHQRITAAVSVTVPSQQFDPQALDEIVAQVCEAAARLSQRISHLPPPARRPQPLLDKTPA